MFSYQKKKTFFTIYAWFLTCNNKICEVLDVKGKEVSARLYSFKKTKLYFDEPVDSKDIGICVLLENTTFKESTIYTKDIEKKFVAIPSKNGMLIPMLHDLEL